MRNGNDTRFEVFKVVRIQVRVFSVMMPCTATVRHQYGESPPKCWYRTPELHGITAQILT